MTPALLALTAICRHRAVARCSRWHLIPGHQQSADRDFPGRDEDWRTPRRRPPTKNSLCVAFSLHRFRWPASPPRRPRKRLLRKSPPAPPAAVAFAASWYPWDPYQVPPSTGTGVSDPDHRLRRGDRAGAGAHHAESKFPSPPDDLRKSTLAALADGRADIASGATASEERSAFAYVSKPYRTEHAML